MKTTKLKLGRTLTDVEGDKMIQALDRSPDHLCTGDGSETNGFVFSGDDVAGFQYVLNECVNSTNADQGIFGRIKGGKVMVNAARYNINHPQGVVIYSAGTVLEGESGGFNTDPNGISQGFHGSRLIFNKTGVCFHSFGGRQGNSQLKHVYLFPQDTTKQAHNIRTRPKMPDGTALQPNTPTAGIIMTGSHDQNVIEDVHVGGADYGLYILKSGTKNHDHSHIDKMNVLGTRVGIYAEQDAFTPYFKILNCTLADLEEHCMDIRTAPLSNNWNWVVKGNFFVRGGSADGIDNPSLVYFGGNRAIFSANTFDRAGVVWPQETTTKQVDGLILAGDNNIVEGNTFSNNGGYAVRVQGDGNVIGVNQYVANGGGVIIESGATGTVVYNVGQTIVDNGTGTIIK